ncbi:MAG: 30S ribosome-binding factor RbfA [Leptospiraceae bacterium]|nr:30S ribosome-binding factor RbfA [Leptospiraceae bacterium]MCP5513234.1 30S ribosome-binding factor RbfA [Leptospiraceae bacterium]
MDAIRKKRIEAEIIRTLGTVFVSGKVKDPGIGMVSLHRAELAEDLSVVKIWVTSYIEEREKGKFLTSLKRASGFLQHILAKELKLRQTPRIVFKWDDNYIKSLEVNALIDELAPKVKDEPIDE